MARTTRRCASRCRPWVWPSWIRSNRRAAFPPVSGDAWRWHACRCGAQGCGCWTSRPPTWMQRDLLLAFRRPGEWLQPLAFFALVTTLFPLAMDPEAALLRQLAPAALWVTLLLTSLLALDFLYREDGRDGTLEQYAVSGQSF